MTIDDATIELIESFFKRYQIKYSHHLNAYMWLLRYFNFRVKFIPSGPRKVSMSSHLLTKLPTHSHAQEVLSIAHKIYFGQDVNPHQSRESFNSNYHDGLFNDWGIHHLHLSDHKKNTDDYFMARSGPLLFVYFTDTVAHLLDIQDHNANNVWSNTYLIRIIQQNWPELIADKEVGQGNWFPNLNDNDIGIMRRKGYTFSINIDGKTYLLIGDGQSTSGDNMRASHLANEVWRWVGDNKQLFENDLTLFKARLKEQLAM